MNDEEVVVGGKRRNPKGYFAFTDKQTGKITEFYSAQCVHCGIHWQVQPGSGRTRGYCRNCQGVICGKELCMTECIPIEAQLEIQEGNKKTIEKYKDTRTCQFLLQNTNGIIR